MFFFKYTSADLPITFCSPTSHLFSAGTASDRIKKLLEFYFVFAVVWGVGGNLAEGKGLDTRRRFSKWWTSEFKNVVFPDSGLVFDFAVDENQMLMVPWADIMDKSQEQTIDVKSNSIFISTPQNFRLKYLMSELLRNNQNVMLVSELRSELLAP